MEQSIKAFKQRLNEIDAGYRSLYDRQLSIEDQMRGLQLEVTRAQKEVTAEMLLSGALERNLKNYQELENELNTLRETYAIVQAKGGLDYLCKTDKQFNELGEALAKDLMKQAKEDDKKRRDLEKRYGKVLAEISKLDEERKAHIQYTEQQTRLAGIIYSKTAVGIDYQAIAGCYNLSNPSLYRHLGNTKHLL